MRRAWASFDKSRLDTCLQPVEFRGTLLGLCFFHSCLVGRIRFGQQGWSRKYSFNMGDLRICGDVLTMYLDAANDDETLPKGLGERVPWQDLRYIFGEISVTGSARTLHRALLKRLCRTIPLPVCTEATSPTSGTAARATPTSR